MSTQKALNVIILVLLVVYAGLGVAYCWAMLIHEELMYLNLALAAVCTALALFNYIKGGYFVCFIWVLSSFYWILK